MAKPSVAKPVTWDGWGCTWFQGTREEILAWGATRGDLWPGDPGARKTTAKTFDTQGRPVKVIKYTARLFRVRRKFTLEEKRTQQEKYEREIREPAREADRLQRAARFNPYPPGSEGRAIWMNAFLGALLEREEARSQDPARMAQVRAAEADVSFQKFLRGLESRSS